MMNKLEIDITDLKEIFEDSKQWFHSLEGKNVFISGGTGFFGKWLINSILYANKFLDKKILITTITRDKTKFDQISLELANAENLTILEGDLSILNNKNIRTDLFIHCAANVLTSSNIEMAKDYIEKEKENTEAVLQFCARNKVSRLVYTSSGAIYGNLTNDHPASKEDDSPQIPLSPYAQAKEKSEELIKDFCTRNKIDFNIARCFAFIGGYIPLNGTFALGNFINNVLNDEDIIIQSDGQSIRSYMYMTDLCSAILNLSCNSNVNKIVNIGSTVEISIEELANKIALHGDNSNIILSVRTKSPHFNKYIPDIRLAEEIFDIRPKVNLNEALKRTIKFYKGY